MKTNKDKSQQKSKRIAVLLVILSVSTSLFAEKGFRLLTTISGEKSGDQFCTVKNVGDVNGDGFNDLLVGAAEASYAKLFFGGTSFDTIADLSMSIPNNLEYFGQTLACGDLNGDGFSDFAIGAPYYDFYSHRGKIFVYFGGTDADAIPDIEIEGYGYNHLIGAAIVCNCDVNGDGYCDLIASSGEYDKTTYIYLGGSNMDNVPDITLTGEYPLSSLGSPSAAGDINNDGYDDFFIDVRSSIYLPSYLSGTGIRLIYGGETISLANSVLFESDSTIGWPLKKEGIGDINHDGYNDFHYSYYVKDVVYLYSGLSLSIIDSIKINKKASFFWSSCGGYDIDNDSNNDFIIGFANMESLYKGDVYVYLGGVACYDSVPNYIISGELKHDYFGYSVDWLGDVNNDGYKEIAIGKRSGNGKVYIYSFGDFQDRIDDESNVEKLDEFSILKAYPNPFNNSTAIRFYLSKSEKVYFTIYDLIGHEVGKINANFYNEGDNNITWNAVGLPSGVYIIKMSSDNRKLSRFQKIILLR